MNSIRRQIIGIVIIFNLFSTDNFGQIPSIKVFGDFFISTFTPTFDGGWIAVGQNTIGNFPNDQMLSLVKMDIDFNIEWSKSYPGIGGGGSHTDIIQTMDSGFVIGTSYFGNMILLKTDNGGGIQWSRGYGGTSVDQCEEVMEDTFGNLIMVGITYSYKPKSSNLYAAYVVKVDVLGNPIWSRSLSPGTSNSFAWHLITGATITKDGRVVATGYGINVGSGLATVSVSFELNAVGGVVWYRAHDMPASGQEASNSVVYHPLHPNRRYFAGGLATSSRPYLHCTDTLGRTLWAKRYDLPLNASAGILDEIYPTADGGFITLGMNVSNLHGDPLIKLDSLGNIEWTKGFGFKDYACSNNSNANYDEGHLYQNISGGYTFMKFEPNAFAFQSLNNTSGLPATIVINTDSLGKITDVSCYDDSVSLELKNIPFVNYDSTYSDTFGVKDTIFSINAISNSLLIINLNCDTQKSDFLWDTVCFGDTTHFTDLYGNAPIIPCSVLWNFGDPASGNTDTSTQENPIHVFTAAGKYNVKLKIYMPYGVDSIIKEVLVFENPIASFSKLPYHTLCSLWEYNAIVDSVGIEKYYWNWGDGGPTDTMTSPRNTHLFPDSGSYKITLIIENRCGQDTVYDTIFVKPFPEVVIISDSVCLGDTTHFTSIVKNVDSVQSYTWGVFPIPSVANPEYVFPLSGNYDIILTVTDTAGCEYLDTTTALVLDYPNAIDTSITICRGSSIILDGGTGLNYLWNPANYLVDNFSQTQIVLADSSITYQIIVESFFCGSDTGMQTIIVNQLPIIKTINDTIINLGDEVILTTTGGVLYNWTPATYLDNTNISNPISLSLSSTVYIVYGIDANGCSASDTLNVTVEVKEDFFIPNAFSPNGEGINDLFVVSGLEGDAKYLMKVFDRWGNKVFESKDKNEAWRGDNNGTMLNAGVYVYWLDVTLLNEQRITRKGNLTLVK